MSPPAVPSVASVILTLAQLTFRRLSRGRSVWVGVVLAFLPTMFAVGVPRALVTDAFQLSLLSTAVLCPMFVGTSLGDEIEERTTTYLWSRPLPRWTVLAGKLAAIIPLVAALVIGGWVLASLARGAGMPATMSLVSLALGAVGISMIATGLATVAPKHGMAVSILYLVFFDLPLGVMPFKLRALSITHQLAEVSGQWSSSTSAASAVVSIAVIAVLFGALAAWRIRKLES